MNDPAYELLANLLGHTVSAIVCNAPCPSPQTLGVKTLVPVRIVQGQVQTWAENVFHLVNEFLCH